MRSALPISSHCLRRTLTNTPKSLRLPIVSIQNGTFYRRYPSPNALESTSNPPIFSNLTFALPSDPASPERWAIIGPSNAGKTTLLEILRGKHICLPPTARSFPFLASEQVDDRVRNPARAVQYVGFDGEQGGLGKGGTRGAYISARYESRRESTDFSVLDYLKGNIDLNPAEGKKQDRNLKESWSLDKIIHDLRLKGLLSMPIGNLSNGQMRRARIAKAILSGPLVLLLDEPFMGLDPPTTILLSSLLQSLAEAATPRLVLALRPQDPMPDWITHIVKLGAGLNVIYQGQKNAVTKSIATQEIVDSTNKDHYSSNPFQIVSIDLPVESSANDSRLPACEPKLPNNSRQSITQDDTIVEMKDVHIKYGDKEVLGDWNVDVAPIGETNSSNRQKGLWWRVQRGERWGVFGPNGTGKTTLISLICSDHPLSYSLPIKIFGRDRLPKPGEPGISIFDIQARIGQASPEIHAFFPRNVSLRRVVENAWADTFLGSPRLTHENKLAVDASLRWFEAELNPAFKHLTSVTNDSRYSAEVGSPRTTEWADELRFGESPFSAQRVALFLRAIVKEPELVVLDEAFSGMDEYVRDKCMLFLTCGETKTFAIRKGSSENTRFIIPTWAETYGQPTLKGLQEAQTLICVSHIKEEVPSILTNWMCLPEAGNKKPARFGRFHRPLAGDQKQWNEIWDL